MENIKDTIMSQYAHSPTILALIDGINEVIDPQYFIDDFYEKVYRLSSAEGFGLDIWADKVDVSRFAKTADPNAKTFGFQPDYQPFNTYPFSDGGAFASYRLTDADLRKLIIIKAASNILYASAWNINKFLLMVFGGRKAYYDITGHMAAQYVFEFALTPFDRLIVYTLNMLPMPSGVGISYKEVDVDRTFGFNGSELSNFNNGVFYSG
ncbi:hypothetical protein [Acinetobacter phage vB_AbaM_BP10]|nr:hypothetical protein [Acinetobacter phage vB_AbaM_BP10]